MLINMCYDTFHILLMVYNSLYRIFNANMFHSYWHVMYTGLNRSNIQNTSSIGIFKNLLLPVALELAFRYKQSSCIRRQTQ